jgi:hypothetical protein
VHHFIVLVYIQYKNICVRDSNILTLAFAYHITCSKTFISSQFRIGKVYTKLWWFDLVNVWSLLPLLHGKNLWIHSKTDAKVLVKIFTPYYLQVEDIKISSRWNYFRENVSTFPFKIPYCGITRWLYKFRSVTKITHEQNHPICYIIIFKSTPECPNLLINFPLSGEG